MKIGEAILEVMEKKEVSIAQVARALGVVYQSIQGNLQRKNMTVKRAVEVLDFLGYEMTIQPKVRGVKAEGQYLINNISKDDKKKRGVKE